MVLGQRNRGGGWGLKQLVLAIHSKFLSCKAGIFYFEFSFFFWYKSFKTRLQQLKKNYEATGIKSLRFSAARRKCIKKKYHYNNSYYQ